MQAYRLLREVERVLAGDPQVEAAARLLTFRGSVRTVPAGAQVAIRDYLAPSGDRDWIVLGTAPLDRIRIPFGYLLWRITRDGYQPAEFGRAPVEGGVSGGAPRLSKFDFVLEPTGRGQPEMVPVPPGDAPTMSGQWMPLPAFHIDRLEVTNREFQAFVEARGYDRPEFWREPFEADGDILSFEEAVGRFRDVTGGQGPATWELGSFLKGQADVPVSGVSWFEAAAFAVFAGKRLPTVYGGTAPLAWASFMRSR